MIKVTRISTWLHGSSHRLAAVILIATAAHAQAPASTAPPVIRGALWWVTQPYYSWTREQIAETVDAQAAVGFDLLWLLNCPGLMTRAESGGEDILETLFSLADERSMEVIVDLPRAGWYGETDAVAIASKTAAFATAFHTRYGAHPSFRGWYLNYEINPIAADDHEQTAFWHAAFKSATDACHAARPGSVVTISPFFLLDRERKRGFIYQTPEEYAAWWGATLKATGIDVLMLQDSGEHLGFFTLEDREPFWAATANACREAGAKFWLNIESAEVPATSWDEYLTWEREKTVRFEVLPMEKLASKLQLAAKYADAIVNWGYFPFMNPHEPEATRTPNAEAANEAYRKYVEQTR
jgi:hypothetical protein